MLASLYKQLHVSVTTFSLALVGISLAVKLCTTIWLKSLTWEDRREYSYLGDDHPDAWPIEIPDILTASDNSLHFKLDTPDGIAEWSAIVPGSGLVYLGPYRVPYTISMLHQLRCLDIIRGAMVDEGRNQTDTKGTPELARHCLNYLKQMVLCRGDLQLEPFLAPSHNDPIDLYGTYECKDWDAVYKEVEKNQLEYARWRETRGYQKRRRAES